WQGPQRSPTRHNKQQAVSRGASAPLSFATKTCAQRLRMVTYAPCHSSGELVKMGPIFSNVAIIRTLLVVILAAGVFFFIGFLVPVLAALIICFASWPLYARLLRACRGNSILAASIALLAILLGIVIPLVIIFSFALEEAKSWGAWLARTNEFGAPMPLWLPDLPLIGETLAEQWATYLGEPQQLGQIVSLVSGAQISGISRWLLAFGWNTAGLMLTLLF